MIGTVLDRSFLRLIVYKVKLPHRRYWDEFGKHWRMILLIKVVNSIITAIASGIL